MFLVHGAGAASADATIPGRIQAEDFDPGGQGVGYSDTEPANLGGAYRLSEAVDVGNDFPDDGTYEIGYIFAGEWLQYTIQVAQAGDYVLRLRMAQYLIGAGFHVELDGMAVTPIVSSPDTQTYNHWVTLPVATLSLTAGTHVLRLVFDRNGAGGAVMNLNWLELTPRAQAAPGRIQAEDFDPVEGVGYHDTTPANVLDLYRRSEGVDVGNTFLDQDFTPGVEYIAAGEWLRYTARVAETANYVMRVRLAQYGAGAAFHVEVDGTNVTGPIAVPDTGAYANWVTLPVLTRTLAAGQHTFRIVFEQDGTNGGVMNLNWFELVPENPVIVENRAAGSTGWMNQAELGGLNDLTYSGSPLKGYASATSVNRGGSITFYVKAPVQSGVFIQIFRMGYYGGASGRLMTTDFFFPPVQPACAAAASGVVECNWNPSYTLSVPSDWTSGIYLVKMNAETVAGTTVGNYITFVVRDDARVADFLYVQPVATYQAYNNYPSENCDSPTASLGKSLYGWNSTDQLRAIRVSFRRPYCGDGAGSEQGDARAVNEVFAHELNLIAWLERQGFDVAYATSLDLHHATPASLARYRAVLSASHDEYWSTAMRDNMEEARDRGVDLAFFGGNAAYWQVRFEDGDQTMACYKQPEPGYPLDDAVPYPLTTTLFREVGRPEQWLLGIQYNDACCVHLHYYEPLENLLASSWVFAASPIPITPSTYVGLTIGNEVDEFMTPTGYPVFAFGGASRSPLFAPSLPRIDPSHYQIFAASHVLGLDDPDGPCPPNCRHNSSVYQAPSGAWVFATGTIGWALDLANVGIYFQESPIITNATSNVLFQFLADPDALARENLALGATVTASSWNDNEWWARANAVDGRRNSAVGTSMGYASDATFENHEEWIELTFPSARTVSGVILFPRNDIDYAGLGFPTDFAIQAWNGIGWEDRLTVSGFLPPGTLGQSFRLPPATTDRLRVRATGLGVSGSSYFMHLAEIEVYGPDGDGDGHNDDRDDCPTLANTDQADLDGDGVGDVCDNCVAIANPRVAADFVSTNPWATLSGGQRDDDYDGFGNRCDADFTTGGVTVGPSDLTQFRSASGKSRASLTACGSPAGQRCSKFDLDESGLTIGPGDLTVYRELSGKVAGPKCTVCPLPCEAGSAGTCF